MRTKSPYTAPSRTRAPMLVLAAVAWGLALFHVVTGDAAQAATPALLGFALLLLLRADR